MNVNVTALIEKTQGKIRKYKCRCLLTKNEKKLGLEKSIRRRSMKYHLDNNHNTYRE